MIGNNFAEMIGNNFAVDYVHEATLCTSFDANPLGGFSANA